MRVSFDMVTLDADAYRRHVDLMRHQQEVLRCLIALDVAGIRRVWKNIAPHLDQPESDWDALRTMHEARIRMARISPQQKRYSEHWLRDLENKTKIAAAVGIAVKALGGDNVERANQVQAAMSEAVIVAVRDGVDIENEVPEVHRRMKIAKLKIYRG
jgi:hypothetical protein